MMDLGKPQGLVKFKVAGFIYYENIREFSGYDDGHATFVAVPIPSQLHCQVISEIGKRISLVNYCEM